MRTWLARRLRHTVAAFGVLVLMGAAMLVPASAAQAGDGTLWSFGWSYTSSTTFTFSGSLLGVAVSGSGTDNDGDRVVDGEVVDTDPGDGRCAAAMVLAFFPPVVLRTACDGERQPFRITGGGSVAFVLGWAPAASGPFNWSFVAEIPTSVYDRDLRAAGNGLTWVYFSSNFAFFVATHSRVRFSGIVLDDPDGVHRFVNATVESTAGLGGLRCVWGMVSGPANKHAVGDVCAPGVDEPMSPPHFEVGGFSGPLTIRACYRTSLFIPDFGFTDVHCVNGSIPMPA
jgi:hypothetical protein